MLDDVASGAQARDREAVEAALLRGRAIDDLERELRGRPRRRAARPRGWSRRAGGRSSTVDVYATPRRRSTSPSATSACSPAARGARSPRRERPARAVRRPARARGRGPRAARRARGPGPRRGRPRAGAARRGPRHARAGADRQPVGARDRRARSGRPPSTCCAGPGCPTSRPRSPCGPRCRRPRRRRTRRRVRERRALRGTGSAGGVKRRDLAR